VETELDPSTAVRAPGAAWGVAEDADEWAVSPSVRAGTVCAPVAAPPRPIGREYPAISSNVPNAGP